MKNNTAELIRSLYDIRQEIAGLRATEKETLEQLKPFVDPLFEGGVPVSGAGITLTRISSASRTISGEKLLERGVSPDIVAYATKTTTYYQYRTKEQKEDNDSE